MPRPSAACSPPQYATPMPMAKDHRCGDRDHAGGDATEDGGGGTGLGLLGDLLDRAVLVGGPDLGDLADGVADDETADHGDGEAPPLLDDLAVLEHEIGRASCRERVCQYV